MIYLFSQNRDSKIRDFNNHPTKHIWRAYTSAANKFHNMVKEMIW